MFPWKETVSTNKPRLLNTRTNCQLGRLVIEYVLADAEATVQQSG